MQRGHIVVPLLVCKAPDLASAACRNRAATSCCPSSAAKAAMLASIWYRKALRSAGTTWVVRMLARLLPAAPCQGTYILLDGQLKALQLV